MKTLNPLIKNLIDFVDAPTRYFRHAEERRKKQNARAWLWALVIVAVTISIWLIVRLAK